MRIKSPTFEKMGRIGELWVLSIFECMILWRSRNIGGIFREGEGPSNPVVDWMQKVLGLLFSTILL